MPEDKVSFSLSKFILSLILTLGAGLIGGLFSMNAKMIFEQLKEPSFAPPSWVFMPVWIFLYIIMGIAFYRVWAKGRETPGVKSAMFYFILQLVFNVLWSVFFFSLGLRAAALVDLIILIIYTAITTVKFFRIDKAAGILMIPYLLWLIFAGALNFAIVLLNG
jgi:tryptophan-rich sensory protein